MTPEIHYFYGDQYVGPDRAGDHEKVLTALERLRATRKISQHKVQHHKERFPTKEDERKFLRELADFSLRHHVSLRQVFGSRRHGFCYLPPQFLLVYAEGKLAEVFPCRVGGTEIGILDYLGRLERGEAWTTSSYRVGKLTRHEQLIEEIVSNADILEAGLRLFGRSVQVSQEFGERRIVDLVFTDIGGRYLLLEVKVKTDEIDKAIGQILRHREIFAKQNFVEKSELRVGIACPIIPAQAQAICEATGIESFELEG